VGVYPALLYIANYCLPRLFVLSSAAELIILPTISPTRSIVTFVPPHAVALLLYHRRDARHVDAYRCLPVPLLDLAGDEHPRHDVRPHQVEPLRP